MTRTQIPRLPRNTPMPDCGLDPLDRNSLEIDLAVAQALRPDPPLHVLDWTKQHRIFPDDGPQPGRFRPETAPYANEPMQACDPDNGVEEICIIKCAQSSGSVIAESFIAAVGAEVGGPGMIVHPTVKAAQDWAEEKFEAMVQAMPRLHTAGQGGVIPRQARELGGSKRDRIRFRERGWFKLAGSNSAASLRQSSIRWGVEDDLDGFAADADGEGDPEKLFDQRLKTFRKQGTAKRLKVSTPLIKGASRIERAYRRSDQRRFYMACREASCGALVDWDWDDVQGVEEGETPFLACPECGTVHEDRHKRDMAAAGLWIPTAPTRTDDDEGEPAKPPKAIRPEDVAHWRNRDMGARARRRGYWITGVMNVFSSLASLAEAWRAAKGDPDAEKVFANTELGHPYAVTTKTPDWDKLWARRDESWRRGDGHPGALVFILSVDVQRDGLFWRINGYARGEQQFSLDFDFLAGETAEPNKGAWIGLRKIADEGAPLPGGARFPLDGIVVDANYNTEAAKEFVRRHPAAIAINGAAGWGKPIIYRIEETDTRKSGRKVRFNGLKIWHVGTFTVKNMLITRYLNTVAGASEDELPKGYQHWPGDADEDFFKQLTSEYVAERKKRGSETVIKEWAQRGPNHYFDCDVYALAMLEHLRMRDGKRGHWTEDDWARRETEIAHVAGASQADLFMPAAKADQPAERRSADGMGPLTALQRLGRLNKGG